MRVAYEHKPAPTDEELHKQFKGIRNLKIERDEDGVSVSYREPCIMCGKYHHRGSKAEKRCGINLLCGVAQMFRGEEDE